MLLLKQTLNLIIMKRSNILIFLPVILILSGLIFYSFKLKELYNTGDYKSRFKDMEFTPMSGIVHLKIESADVIGLDIEYGEKEGIWIYSSNKNNIKKVVKGDTLNLNLIAYPNDSEYLMGYGMILVTKNLKSIITKPGFSDFGNDAAHSSISISNYVLDQLDLKIAPHVIVSLNKVKLNKLNAVVGNKTQDWAQLWMGSDVIIDDASFDIPGKGVLELKNPRIKKADYHVSDSAEVSLNGKVLEAIKN